MHTHLATILGLMLIVCPSYSEDTFHHKCPKEANPSRIIKELKEIKAVKVIKSYQPKLPDYLDNVCSPGPVAVKLEVLINEKGQVECASVFDSNCRLPAFLEYCESAVMKWEYQPPQDHNGNAVSCYQIVVIRFKKVY